MILSEADKTVVWELNELLAADRRARAFSEASIGGEYAKRSTGFEEAHWQTIGGDADMDEAATENEEPLAGEIEGETEVLEDDAELEEVVDVDQLLEERYKEGLAEGIRQSNLESQTREALAERFVEVVRSEMAALPRVWPVVTDLSLDIAKTVCLQSLRFNENIFRQYLSKALEAVGQVFQPVGQALSGLGKQTSSFFEGIGGLVGSLFGGKKQRSEAEAQRSRSAAAAEWAPES